MINERLRKMKTEAFLFKSKLEVNIAITRLYKDFLFVAKTYGRIIISERYLPLENKTIKPRSLGGIIGGEKYYCSGVYFKFAHDSHAIFGSDEPPMKIAGLELKHLINLYDLNPRVSLPLICLIDYRGFRLIATSQLPIDPSESLVMGSSDAGKTIHEPPAEIEPYVQQIARAFNLREHHCGGKSIPLCVDLEAHIGLDGRCYFLDFSRLFPPEADWRTGRPRSDLKYSYLWRLLRPELVRNCKKRLSADAFSPFQSKEEGSECNKDVFEASLELHTVVIPRFASELLEFVYLFIQRGTLPEFPFKRILHTRGINLRHSGKLLDYLAAEKVQPFMQKALLGCRLILLVEIIARAFRVVLNQSLREEAQRLRKPLDSPFLTIYCAALRSLSELSSDTKEFRRRLMDTITSKFESRHVKELIHSTDNPFNDLSQVLASGTILRISWHNVLLQKICNLCGCKLKKHITNNLGTTKREFDEIVQKIYEGDLREIKERVKEMPLIANAEGYIAKLLCNVHQASNLQYSQLRAEHAFINALELNPNNSIALRNIAQIYALQGHPLHPKTPCIENLLKPKCAQALNFFYEAIKGPTPDSDSLYQLGEFQLNCLGDNEGALLHLIEAIQVDPLHQSCLSTLAYLCSLLKRVTEGRLVQERLQLSRQLIKDPISPK